MESSTSPVTPGAGAYGTPTGTGGTTTSEDGGGAQSAAQQAQEKVSEVAGQAQEQARTTLRSQVDERSTQAGEQVVTQANDVRTVAEKLREEGKEGPAKVAEQAADRVEKVGGYLRDSDADTILSDVESYARSNPWTVVAGGLALGFVASRFLKASSGDRYHGRTPAPASRQLPARTVTPPPPPVSGPPPVAAPAMPTTTNPGTGTF